MSVGHIDQDVRRATKRDSRSFFERQLFKDMYWRIVQLRSVKCFPKIKVNMMCVDKAGIKSIFSIQISCQIWMFSCTALQQIYSIYKK